ncbi:MAG TPA: DUF5818 domain-containing protein [Candidatus Cybelea sp.]|nr:DUF5818 domain-containing protein [Candidatus Cybelea sp.]
MSKLKYRPVFWTVAALALAAVSAVRAGDEKVFKGVITDSQCALNVHSLSRSHKEMLKSHEVGSTPEDCVWYCIKQRGGRFVLQEGKKVYKLDEQDVGRELANKQVEVVGTLDPQTNTIHVTRIVLPNGRPAS